MDALTYDEPSKSKKGTLKKIEERGEDLAYLQEMPGIGNSSTGNRGRFKCCRKGYDYQSHDSASRPAGIQGHCIASPNRDEQLRPFLWRFWRRTPSADRMAIFDRSWYRSLLDAQINGIISEAGFKKGLRGCAEF